ncbi:MAG TPA: lipopolysaccharide assembly protein LapB, partial [Burkholderiaceae bacterium]|nr:lipopolysaccharide assembly protein LapB [Burkholderiaceae bacterium]
RRQPSFAALTKVYEAEVELAAATPANVESTPDATVTASEDLVVARDLLKQRTRNLARYTCHECGFRARLFYWQCPGCNRWETYAPRRAEVAASGGASM